MAKVGVPLSAKLLNTVFRLPAAADACSRSEPPPRVGSFSPGVSVKIASVESSIGEEHCKATPKFKSNVLLSD